MDTNMNRSLCANENIPNFCTQCKKFDRCLKIYKNVNTCEKEIQGKEPIVRRKIENEPKKMYVTVIDGNKEDNKVQEVLIVEESSSKVDERMETIHVEKSNG